MTTTMLVILLLLLSKSHALFFPFNSSTLSPLLNSEPEPPPPPPPPSNSLLKQVLKAIAEKERWDPDGEIRVSDLDAESVRVGRSQSYEFHVRVKRTVFALKFPVEVESWRKPGSDWTGFGQDLEFGEGLGEDPRPVVGALELEGPLDLRVVGEDGELSVVLPALNVTHGGLRRTLVGDGIRIRLEGAQEITLIHPQDIRLLLNRSLVKLNQDSNQFWALGHPSCAPLPLVRVTGSASLVAFRTHNSEAYVKSEFHSEDTIQLLSEKCYSNGHFKQLPSWVLGILSSKVVLLEKVLRYFLGKGILQRGSARFLKAKITSSSLVKLRLQVERDITENDRIWKRVPSWRTKPVSERIWFELLATVKAGKGWKQVLVKKLSRPIMAVESSPWSNLMSNISFTQFSSIILPPDALTLDV